MSELQRIAAKLRRKGLSADERLQLQRRRAELLVMRDYRREADDARQAQKNPWRWNPSRVKGHKTRGGGRSVTLKNFTGTVTKKGGQVIIRGRGKR
jgi:hypothetical protein